MNLFVGREDRHRHRKWTYRHEMGEGEGGTNGESGTDIYTLSNRQLVGSCSIAKGAQLGAL